MKTEADYKFDADRTWNNGRDVDVLLGQTIKAVTESDDEIIFITEQGYTYKMYHDQDCCEHVYIESIVGDIQDLVGQQILEAEERTNEEGKELENSDDSFTWTFYTIRCVKCSIDIRWYGTSNGYYSESVDFERIA